jgi:hypothetical protein
MSGDANWLGTVTEDPGPPPLYDVPSPTQLNGTGTTVDLVPTFYADGNNVEITADVTTIYTTPVSVGPGQYFCTCSIFYFKTVSGSADWNTNENYALEVQNNISGTIASCDLTFSPYYMAYKDGLNCNSYISFSGVVGLSGTGTIRVVLTTLNRSAGKSIRVDILSIQKISPVYDP